MKVQYYVRWSGKDGTFRSYPCADVHTAEHLVKFLHAELQMYSAFVKGVATVPSRGAEGSGSG